MQISRKIYDKPQNKKKLFLKLTIFFRLLPLFLTTVTPSYIHATFKTLFEDNEKGEAVETWQLFNHCSKGFLQLFLNEVNAQGKVDNDCLSEFC